MKFRVVRTNQYNQDLGLIHSTNGNHLESPNEGSSIDHQVTIHLHAQNITMFPTNETWSGFEESVLWSVRWQASEFVVSGSAGHLPYLWADWKLFEDVSARGRCPNLSQKDPSGGSLWMTHPPAQPQRSGYQPSEASRFRGPPQSQHSGPQRAHVNVLSKEQAHDDLREE
ncbi:L-ascorbate oxidase precursor [Dorcoceras hygrometricum]|uniref:L-ascorbate oxidase n=1 Tax=Dorcoceras hygrometricum TaxID=472368 RepID=A0A2Z7AMU0_9LAMI|nr:L-ascorbate oxidase precursor [Dorcoceras hygrometricum]